ncbi:MAG TPA: C25 family cysteine peptidase [Thermoanaerobaculia bacterium]|jgi:hypothetical protein|nr:C25 family cysteine peptidase [Thermoanaerobaculia bacterium]
MLLRPTAGFVCALALLSGSLYAGSTTSLHTPQGSGAASDNGDFVTSADTSGTDAMNTYYSYFIEVPAGLTSLQVQIFDADIGFGGGTEDTDGRDRNRGDYGSVATYSLRNPSGTVQTVRFTTGDVNEPANSDNAWLTLYGVGNSVRDNFTTAAFSNNDGTADWAANWIETDAGGAGVAAGAVRIVGGQAQMQDGVAGLPALERQVDLLGTPGLDLVTATFSYSYTNQNTEANDSVLVQVSNNGGGAWTLLATIPGTSASGNGSHNITTSRADNTRVRFIMNGGYTDANELFTFDNVLITDAVSTPMAGHWEVRVAMNGGSDDDDDINAIGIRAHDGDASAGGTELNVYADSFLSLGTNPDGSGGASRSYVLYPWVTAGCSATQNDFDRDTNSGTNNGTVTYTSRLGTFTQSFTDATTSTDDVWNRDDITNYTSNHISSDYGIWRVNSSINTYENETGNYETYYVGNYLNGANPPGGTLTQPYTSGGFPAAYRIYMPTDAGTAPVKPYLEQFLTAAGGPQPNPALGVARTYTVTVNVINPTIYPITFSASNNVVANVPPGTGTVYAGGLTMSPGTSIVSNPANGGTGNVTWNPNTVAAGGSATLSYNVTVTPAAATTSVTGDPTGGNGTRATYVDETGNATQARSTYRLGGLCHLRLVVGALTEAMLASFEVDERGRVSWSTASEAGTIGYNLYREDGSKVNRNLIPAGKRIYHVDDRNMAERYLLEEITSSGRINRHGPLVTGRRLGPEVEKPIERGMSPSPVVTSAKGVAVMVGVRETGIVRVPFTEIASRVNKTVAQIEKNATKGDLAVTTGGQVVAWTSTADALLFFGEKSESLYTKDRIYRIDLNRGVKMADVAVAPSSTALSQFDSTVVAETDTFPATVLPLDPESDYWFWDFVLSGDPTFGRKTFAVEAADMANANNAVLEVRLQGAFTGASHTARVRLNNVPVGELSWIDLNAGIASFAVPAGVLVSGTNQVEIEGVLAPSTPFDVFYIDGFTLRYRRFARPVNGAVEASLTSTVKAGPFTATPIALNINNRLRPALLNGGSFAAGDFGATLPSGATNVFVTDRFVMPASYRPVYEPSLRLQRADYIVIAPAALRAGAEALATLRQGQGLRTMVADLEQIYDEFSYGSPTPYAIRAYLAGALKESQRPRFVVLAGTGSLDYRGINQSAGLVPPLMVKTNDGLFASDMTIADTNNNGVPDIAIGRLPISSQQELFDYINKLNQHAASADTNPIVFSADQIDQGTNFGAASDESAVAMEGRPQERLHIDELGAQATRDGLIAAWQSGTPLVNWIGHGGLDQIASTGILTAGDAPSLTSTGRLPVLVAMTCTINRFEVTVEPLGSALTRQANGGALAVWSASGLSNHENAREMQRTFMKLAAQRPELRLGELIVLTHAAHPSDTAKLYVLLGDPAIALDLPKETTNGGPPSTTGE